MAAYVFSRVRTGQVDLLADTVAINATGDQAVIPTTAEMQARGFRVRAVYLYNATATPVLAQVAIYDAASAGGNNIVAAAVITALNSAAKIQSSTLAFTDKVTAANLYVNIAVANAAAATISVKIECDLL